MSLTHSSCVFSGLSYWFDSTLPKKQFVGKKKVWNTLHVEVHELMEAYNRIPFVNQNAVRYVSVSSLALYFYIFYYYIYLC